mmetsp:Transcript_6584/g.13867  ORF Transcript_6584/g.13867 Transcript_6584/m.13867 type:complete len:202 (+) Transcript_6584:2-607(+)
MSKLFYSYIITLILHCCYLPRCLVSSFPIFFTYHHNSNAIKWIHFRPSFCERMLLTEFNFGADIAFRISCLAFSQEYLCLRSAASLEHALSKRWPIVVVIIISSPSIMIITTFPIAAVHIRCIIVRCLVITIIISPTAPWFHFGIPACRVIVRTFRVIAIIVTITSSPAILVMIIRLPIRVPIFGIIIIDIAIIIIVLISR